ncbi:MAG: DUF1638 domain-containing protein [Kiritimatiellia bacterium]
MISCNVFQHEIEAVARERGDALDATYIELGEHARPSLLRKKLQDAIDAAVACDAVLLFYGLCGRATDGLVARDVPLVLPRCHDCCAVLLGGMARYAAVFREMPSTPFSSIGFIRHGNYYFEDGDLVEGDSYEALVEKYGEDNAQYILEAMRPKLEGRLQPVYFISTPEVPCSAEKAACMEKAASEGREFRELEGSLRLIRMLLAGEHPPEEFLTVPPGCRIRQTGDWDSVFKCECAG